MSKPFLYFINFIKNSLIVLFFGVGLPFFILYFFYEKMDYGEEVIFFFFSALWVIVIFPMIMFVWMSVDKRKELKKSIITGEPQKQFFYLFYYLPYLNIIIYLTQKDVNKYTKKEENNAKYPSGIV